jgi:hypothetical protein
MEPEVIVGATRIPFLGVTTDDRFGVTNRRSETCKQTGPHACILGLLRTFRAAGGLPQRAVPLAWTIE